MTVAHAIAVHLSADHRREALERDARVGLTASPKWLPPVWFYDERGSRLFDEITRLDEYYPTRAERAILEAHASEIVRDVDSLVELGSGTSEKTHLLLAAMQERSSLVRFTALDVSEEVLAEATTTIARQYGIEVHAVVGDFLRHLDRLPTDGRRLIAFLGSTIGNLDERQRRRFLLDLDASMHWDERLLLGTDLVKDRRRLIAAYDDARGVTAEFNRNVLRVLNAQLGANFDPGAFDHVAVWDEDQRWIEMRLRARTAQVVTIPALELTVTFAAGEELRTETSAKFTPEQVEAELWESGFVVESTWQDEGGDFQLTLARPYC